MNEKTLSTKPIFKGRVVNIEVLDIEMENGVRSVREVMRHRGAALVIPRLPDGRLVLVRQFRKAIEQELLEFVAGTLDSPEEDPLLCAHRELAEEAGLKARTMTSLGVIFPAPGYVDEKIEIFYAETDGTRMPTDFDEDESLEVIELTESEFIDKMRAGEIQDSKTLAAWMLYENMKHHA